MKLDRLTLQKVRRSVVYTLASFYAIIVICMMGNFVKKTQPFHSYGATVEQILEYTAAKNYVTRGFLPNLFLADYSSSPMEQDHPYLYTHMPSGPAVFLGSLLGAGLDLLHARMVFALITFLGFLFLFLLLCKVTDLPELALAALIVYTLDYNGQLRYTEHFVHSFWGINYFGSILFYLLLIEKRTPLRVVAFGLCLSIGFLTSFISCIPCFVTLLLIHQIQNRNHPTSRFLMKMMMMIGGFVALALLSRNFIVLGPDVAFKDFLYTLSNRITAWPSKDSLMEFFDSHKMVLWGVGKLAGSQLQNWLLHALIDPIYEFRVAIISIALSFWALRVSPKPLLAPITRLILIFLGAYAWHIIFFAQGAIYAFAPIFRMARIGVLVILGYSLVHLYCTVWRDRNANRTNENALGRAALIALLYATFALLGPTIAGLKAKSRELKDFRASGFESKTIKSFAKLNGIPDGPILTNIDALMLNFFVPNLTFGGCDLKAMIEKDPMRCPSSFVTRKTKEEAKPQYYFLSTAYVPGYQTCIGDCLPKLIANLRATNEVLREEPGQWILMRIKD